jgi:hypothetical protein
MMARSIKSYTPGRHTDDDRRPAVIRRRLKECAGGLGFLAAMDAERKILALQFARR